MSYGTAVKYGRNEMRVEFPVDFSIAEEVMKFCYVFCTHSSAAAETGTCFQHCFFDLLRELAIISH